MIPHRGKGRVRFVRGNNRDQLPFIGDIQRIEPENFAGAFHFLADRDRRFLQENADLG